MIINPKPLWLRSKAELDIVFCEAGKKWVYFKVNDAQHPDAPLFQPIIVLCDCRTKGKTLAQLERISISDVSYTKVDCHPSKWRMERSGQHCMIWVGMCCRCQNVLWTCDSFAWVDELTDMELTKCFVESLGISSRIVGKNYKTMIIDPCDIIFNPEGKIA